MADVAGFRAAVRSAIEADRQNARKWTPLYDWFSSEFGTSKMQVGPKLLTEGKQLSNRIRKELAELDPQYVVLACLTDRDFDLDDVVRQLDQANLPHAKCALLLDGTEVRRIFVYENDQVVSSLAALFPSVSAESRARPVLARQQAGTSPTGSVPTVPQVVDNPVIIDDRVRRMVRLSIISNRATILVGPPGTGKTTLLSQVLDELRAEPGRYGFSNEIEPAVWVTPQESWTTGDLVGGDSIDARGLIRFRPGLVLDALQQNRWMVLDEANRADMDKIFGGLLTWLSGHPVELGRAAASPDAPVVTLEWDEESPHCSVSNADALAAESPSGEAVRFLGGTDWRFVGTYNAIDAQRVFRFGQAIGRRFARVPIPPATVEQFRIAASQVVDSDMPWLCDAIVALYAAHLDDPATELGPALFLRIPAYVERGLVGLGEGTDRAGAAPEVLGTGSTSEPVHDDNEGGDSSGAADSVMVFPSVEARRLLAEGYLVNVGTWINRLEPEDADGLRSRVVHQQGVFGADDWSWIVDLARNLG